MAKTVAELGALAAEVMALSTEGKIRMASALVALGKLDVAGSVAQAAIEDLQSRRLLKIARAPLTSLDKKAR